MDNTADSWAVEAVEWAVENKLVYGDENGDLQLHKVCTRQEMLVFIYRLYELLR